MADSSDVFKEFLVRVGFTVDKTSQAKVTRGVNEIEGMLKKLAAFAASGAVAGLFMKLADDMDKLYWATKRLNSSAEDIKAFEYSIGQLGGTAQGARSALEGVANFMRSNPGSAGFLRRLGVAPGDVNNAVAATRDLGAIFRNMPYYRAQNYAQMLGIDPITLQAMERDTGVFEANYKRFAHSIGVNLDDVARRANRFETTFREYKAEGGLIVAALGLNAFETIQPYLDRFSAWIRDLEGGGGGDLGDLVRDFEGLASAIGKLIGAIHGLTQSTAFHDWLHTAIGALGTMINTTTHFVNMITAIARGDWKGAAAEGKASASTLVHGVVNVGKGIAKVGGDLLPHGSTPSVPASTGGTRADQAFAFFTKMGVSAKAAAGIVAGLFAESGLNPANVNPSSGAFGLEQALGSRKRGLFAMFGPNPTFEQQLAWIWSEMTGSESGRMGSIFGAKTSGGALAAFIRNFERPGKGGETSGDLRRGNRFLAGHNFGVSLGVGTAGGASINQRTEIHLHGTSADAAHQVAATQDRVNDRLVRNMNAKVW